MHQVTFSQLTLYSIVCGWRSMTFFFLYSHYSGSSRQFNHHSLLLLTHLIDASESFSHLFTVLSINLLSLSPSLLFFVSSPPDLSLARSAIFTVIRFCDSSCTLGYLLHHPLSRQLTVHYFTETHCMRNDYQPSIGEFIALWTVNIIEMWGEVEKKSTPLTASKKEEETEIFRLHCCCWWWWCHGWPSCKLLQRAQANTHLDSFSLSLLCHTLFLLFFSLLSRASSLTSSYVCLCKFLRRKFTLT